MRLCLHSDCSHHTRRWTQSSTNSTISWVVSLEHISLADCSKRLRKPEKDEIDVSVGRGWKRVLECTPWCFWMKVRVAPPTAWMCRSFSCAACLTCPAPLLSTTGRTFICEWEHLHCHKMLLQSVHHRPGTYEISSRSGTSLPSSCKTIGASDSFSSLVTWVTKFCSSLFCACVCVHPVLHLPIQEWRKAASQTVGSC